jgi:hypothetical protein
MKQYYTFLGSEQSGPFTLEELIYKIKAETLVWHEGLPEWQRADTIEELKNHFKSAPPPVPHNVTTTPVSVQAYAELEYEGRKIGIRRRIFIYSTIGITLIVGIIAYNNYNEEKAFENFQNEMRITELNQQLETAHKNLKNAKKELNDVTAFKVLRSKEKRNNEITNAENIVKSLEEEVKMLENQIKIINE